MNAKHGCNLNDYLLEFASSVTRVTVFRIDRTDGRVEALGRDARDASLFSRKHSNACSRWNENGEGARDEQADGVVAIVNDSIKRRLDRGRLIERVRRTLREQMKLVCVPCTTFLGNRSVIVVASRRINRLLAFPSLLFSGFSLLHSFCRVFRTRSF